MGEHAAFHFFRIATGLSRNIFWTKSGRALKHQLADPVFVQYREPGRQKPAEGLPDNVELIANDLIGKLARQFCQGRHGVDFVMSRRGFEARRNHHTNAVFFAEFVEGVSSELDRLAGLSGGQRRDGMAGLADVVGQHVGFASPANAKRLGLLVAALGG